MRVRLRAWGGHLTTMLSRFSPSAIVGSRDQTHVARLVLCSRLLLSGWDKTLTKTNLEREGSFSSHSFVVYQGGKSKSELKARAGKRNQGGTLLPGLSPWLAPLPFFYKPGPPAQACCHPQCSGLTSSISSNPESALVA